MIDNVKILVVDNDRLVKDLIVTALTYCVNREVKPFDNGKQAWKFIQDGGEVDIVISDVDVPGMNGFELMSCIREKHPGMIFIIMSGVAGDEKQSQLAGASAFLAKPFEINDLFSLVQCFVVDQPSA